MALKVISFWLYSWDFTLSNLLVSILSSLPILNAGLQSCLNFLTFFYLASFLSSSFPPTCAFKYFLSSKDSSVFYFPIFSTAFLHLPELVFVFHFHFLIFFLQILALPLQFSPFPTHAFLHASSVDSFLPTFLNYISFSNYCLQLYNFKSHLDSV